MWERAREGEGNAIAPSRRSADGWTWTARQEKKERRKESDPILVKFCARYMFAPSPPSPLLKPLCCRRKDRSCQRGWLQIKNLLLPSLSLSPPPSSSHIPISSDGGIPACIQGGREEDPAGPKKGYFPQKRETELLSQIILKRPVMHEEEKEGPMDWWSGSLVSECSVEKILLLKLSSVTTH